MKSIAISAMMLLTLLLTACTHTLRKHPAQAPSAITAPTLAASNAISTDQPSSVSNVNEDSKIQTAVKATVAASSASNAPAHNQKTKFKPRPSPSHAAPSANTTPAASNNAPAPPPNSLEVSNQSPAFNIIGKLSSGVGSGSQKTTQDLIVTVERDLNGITRTLSNQERETVAKIREYLKQAKTALATGDVDGAQTLAAKAKLLLGELTR